MLLVVVFQVSFGGKGALGLDKIYLREEIAHNCRNYYVCKCGVLLFSLM